MFCKVIILPYFILFYTILHIILLYCGMDLQKKLLNEFEKTYGKRNPNTSRFGFTSLGEIADQLCLSNSLLTKLISGTATQGMYERCLSNLERINNTNRLGKENISLKEENTILQEEITIKSSYAPIWKVMLFMVPILGIIGMLLYNHLDTNRHSTNELSAEHPSNFLNSFFNPEFSVPNFLPYVPSHKVQDYCPCSAFEGDWVLNKSYTIPIPLNQPGLYYVARSSDIKMKCSISEDEKTKGTKLHGFEIMNHELWMDTEQESLMPRFFDAEKKQFTKDFFNIDFQGDSRYVKVSDIVSFFYNKIHITNERIIRNGEPCGRYASYINQDAVSRFKIDMKEVLNYFVGDMIEVKCNDIPNPYCNPNELVEGESLLEFKCNFSIATENLGIGGNYPYAKGFRLVNQHYTHNLLCNC